MSYKQCPFCGEKNIQRGYGTGVYLMTQDNRPWIGCPSCQYWIRGNDCVRRSLKQNYMVLKVAIKTVEVMLRSWLITLDYKKDNL